MFHRKLMNEQMISAGVRLGDSCSICPIHGRKKAFTLNRKCIDLISSHYRPLGLSGSYIELPNTVIDPFHYRLELDEGMVKDPRFLLRTIKGQAFWLNGLAVKEAYVERLDRLYIDDNKVNFFPHGLEEQTRAHFDHPILLQKSLIESELKILIQGETGTGKTYLASKIHQKSGRQGSFISVNLSSFNPQLIESELFGHKKGSFTGAINDKLGAFAMAEHGTLFLDEVDSLPHDLQTKILTFIDDKKYRRVGDTTEKNIKTRLIFASGRSLENLVIQGTMRKDLYYRFKSGHTIDLPTLRSNVEHIRSCCQAYCLKHGVSLSQRLMDFFESLAWPGNLRQLLGHLDKKIILSRSNNFDFYHVDEELLLQSSDLMSLSVPNEILSMDVIKSNHIKSALRTFEGNVALTARRLKISQKTVRTLMEKV
jgi:transcriptional regulator of acetoin/glycerol metabolism